MECPGLLSNRSADDWRDHRVVKRPSVDERLGSSGYGLRLYWILNTSVVFSFSTPKNSSQVLLGHSAVSLTERVLLEN